MNTAQKRLEYFIKEHLGTSIRDFEISIGAGHSTIDKYLKKNLKTALPSDDLLNKISTKYKDLNTAWLLTGSEPMLISETKVHKIPGEVIEALQETWVQKEVAHLREVIKLQNELINELRKNK